MKSEGRENISVTLKALGKEILPSFIPLLIMLVVLFVIHHGSSFSAEIRAIAQQETEITKLSRNVILSKTEGLLADTAYLARVTERILGEKIPGNINERLAQTFMEYSSQHKSFSQIRYIDLTGKEVTRVNRTNNVSVVVPDIELQQKAGRYYFKSLEGLKSENFYVSPLDLNVDGGIIEQPGQPTIRIGTNVFDSLGSRTGWLIANISANYMLAAFRESIGGAGNSLLLLNREGYYLVNPNHEDNWSFMFDKSRSFVDDYEELWTYISKGSGGQLYNDVGIVTYSTVYPFENSTNYYWKVVSLLPNDKFEGIGWTVFKRNILLYLLLLLLCTTAICVIGYYRIHLDHVRLQREYGKNYKNILQDIGLLAVSLNEEGKISYCNDHFLKKIGCDYEQVVNHAFSEFVPVSARFLERERLIDVFNNNISQQQFRGSLVTINNRELTIDWSATLTQDRPVRIPRLTLIGKDITDLLATEEELYTLSRAVEQSASTVMITNADAEIQYVNPKFEQLTGYSAEEVRGRNPRFLQSGETSAEEYKKLWNTVLNGGLWRGEFHNRKKNGELYWELTTISQIRNQDGETTHYLAVKEDLTEQKRLQEEAEVREKEIMQNRELAIVGRIANMIAHDLRNPLSSVKMTLQILGKNQHEAKEKEELVAISLDQVRYMENMITDLLSYSRQSDLNPEWLSVDKLLDTAVSVTQKAITTNGVCVKTEYQTGLPTLFGDRTRLIQVFSNLILNAVQATKRNSETSTLIVIRAHLLLSAEGTNIHVDIHDNGEGVAGEVITRMYEPFFTTRAKGTGLGLAIVQRVVKQHFGSVSLIPSRAGGMHAFVTLPTNALFNESVERESVKSESLEREVAS